jgi:cellulose biosynthesis protein BcsQ
MKTIATINFKGGVGKTTVTWALAQVVAQDPKKTSLMFDLDAQMSLTQAIALRACLKTRQGLPKRANMSRIIATYTMTSPVCAWRS